MDTAQGPGRRMASSVGTAVRRIPPGAPGWAAALLASTPRARRPWTRSAHRPRALSLKAIWEGVLLPWGMLPTPGAPLCRGGWPVLPPPGPAPASAAPTGLAQLGLAARPTWGSLEPQWAPPPPHMCDHACAPLGADSPATVAVADAVLAPQVREDVVVESVQQRVHVHQARDGLEEPMTGQRRGARGWAGAPRRGPTRWGWGSAGRAGR